MRSTSRRIFALRSVLLPLVIFSSGVSVLSFARDVRWISSSEGHGWQEMPSPEVLPAKANDPAALKVDPTVTYQSIMGFGGCFNELAWQALEALPAEQRDEALQALFGPGGCNFTTCRMGIGANDFALQWYSLDETPGDYEMEHFNLDEDRKTLIPYIRAAMQIQPQLAIWGVPWSPPSWMKTNGSYKGANTGRMKQDSKTLAAYALYFSKYVQAYRAERIPVRGIFPQNEPIWFDANYPQCGWSPEEMNVFIRDYLVPRLREDHVAVEVWLGTLPYKDKAKGLDDFINPVFGDPVTNPMLVGLGGQYEAQQLFQRTHDKYPDKKILQTETECYLGENNWTQAMLTFDHIIDDMLHFANGYMYWNMVLNEKATSTWGWHQNSLIIADGQSKKITYNPEFYALKHFGNLVKPGAVRIKLGGPLPSAVAFRNPSGELIVCFSNDQGTPVPTELQVGHEVIKLTVPAKSMNSIVISPNAGT